MINIYFSWKHRLGLIEINMHKDNTKIQYGLMGVVTFNAWVWLPMYLSLRVSPCPWTFIDVLKWMCISSIPRGGRLANCHLMAEASLPKRSEESDHFGSLHRDYLLITVTLWNSDKFWPAYKHGQPKYICYWFITLRESLTGSSARRGFELQESHLTRSKPG